MTIFEKGDEIMSDEIFIQQNLDDRVCSYVSKTRSDWLTW